MRKTLIAIMLTPFLLIASCCALLTYSRSLPNGHSIQYANSNSCYVIDRNYNVVVDDHIVSWTVRGSLVNGTMSNGTKFVLDTATSTVTYSNGISISNGKPVKVRDLPNGYTLWSDGNSEHIIEPHTNFLVGPRDALNVAHDDGSTITGTDGRGMKFEIDTITGVHKFQRRLQGGKTGWATLDESGRTVVVDPPVIGAG